MFSNKLYTPLRYPGGKARFAPFLSRLIRDNHLDGGHYVEPYAGGAGAALELLFHAAVSEVHINDLDPAVHAFWLAATRHTDQLIELVQNTKISMREWRRLRLVMLHPESHDIVTRGFATLFMNRTNRSGILKGGVVGGKQQRGDYRLDARFKKDVLIERLLLIAAFRRQIHVHGQDAVALLRRRWMPEKTIVFLDPPYFRKGRGLYRNFYSYRDHALVASLLHNSMSVPWVVSYDDTPEIRQLYKGSRRLKYRLNYSANVQYAGSEIMFFSKDMVLPRRVGPALRAMVSVG